MNVHIDLIGCEDDEDTLIRIGEVLQLGGPKGNINIDQLKTEGERLNKGWGMNWDALDDILYCLGEWDKMNYKIKFPLSIYFHNHEYLKKKNSKAFNNLMEIFENHKNILNKKGDNLEIFFD